MAVGQHPVDFVGEDIDAAGIAEQQRIFERLKPVDEDQQRDAEDGRRQHREGDRRHHLELAGAERDRGLLVGRVHLLEEADQHQEHEGDRVQRCMEDQPAPAVEIDHRPLDAEDLLRQLVDHAVLRVAEHQPSERRQQIGDEERDRYHPAHQAGEGHIGARHRPGEQQGKEQPDRQPRGGKDHAVEEDRQQIPGAEPDRVIGEREAAEPARLTGKEARRQQDREGIKHEHGEKQRQAGHRTPPAGCRAAPSRVFAVPRRRQRPAARCAATSAGALIAGSGGKGPYPPARSTA